MNRSFFLVFFLTIASVLPSCRKDDSSAPQKMEEGDTLHIVHGDNAWWESFFDDYRSIVVSGELTHTELSVLAASMIRKDVDLLDLRDLTTPDSVIGERETFYASRIGKLVMPSKIEVLYAPLCISVDECESLEDTGFEKIISVVRDIAGIFGDGVLKEKDVPSLFNGSLRAKSFPLPRNLKEISGSVFRDWKDLEEVSLPKGAVVTDGSAMFAHCSSLRKVSFPNQGDNLGDYMFYDCKNLQSVEIPAEGDYLRIGYLFDAHTAGNLHFDLRFYSDVDTKHCNFISSIDFAYPSTGAALIRRIATDPYGVLGPKIRFFCNEKVLKSVYMGVDKTIRDIRPFYTVDYNLVLGPEVEEVEENALRYTYVEYVTPECRLKKIGPYAFFGCVFTSPLDLTGLEEIPDYCFMSSRMGVKDIVIPSNIKRIGEYAFASNRFDSVTIEEGCEAIGTNAFAVPGVLTADMPSTIKSLGEDVFGSYPTLKTCIIRAHEVPEGFAKMAQGRCLFDVYVPKYSMGRYRMAAKGTLMEDRIYPLDGVL